MIEVLLALIYVGIWFIFFRLGDIHESIKEHFKNK
jgi:hypothetical protein